MEKENEIYLSVYLGLVALTALTVGSSLMGWGRILTIVMAFAIASTKALLIVFYYMHLRHERPLVYGILLTGIAAVAILAFGILPDALRF